MAVGFIGLGNIGAPMAKHLQSWDDGLVIFDVSPTALQPFVDAGAFAAGSPAEMANRCDLICVVVQNEQQVREVLTRDDGILQTAHPGTVVAVHSTMSADAALEFADLCQEMDVDFLDAPISGGAIGAHEGTLAVMVGGSGEALTKIRPVLERFGSLIVHTGDVGSGTRTKIARNLITFGSFAVVGEAQRLAEAGGIDIQLLGQVVRHSDEITGGAGAIMLRPNTNPLADDDGLKPIFQHTSALGHKDLELAVQLANNLGVSAPFAKLAQMHLDEALGLHGTESTTNDVDDKGALASLDHVELTNVIRECLLGGQMIDRAGMPHLIAAYGRDVMGEIAIDEWMGASPIYSVRTQELLGFGGPSVETLFKNIQLDIGAPPEFMDFQFRIDSDDYGEFWLDYCGALMDVEPMGDDYVHTMCHTIEDPTFDATAMATSPYARIRPIHRPPRQPADRHPHCHWYASIDNSLEPLTEPGITSLIRETKAAQLPLSAVDQSGPGRNDYSQALQNSLPFHDFSRGVLVALHQEVSLQWHLLVLACGAAIASRYGIQDARDVLTKQFVGVAGLTAERLHQALGGDGSIRSLARILALHPAWNPRSYITTNIDIDESAQQLTFSILDCVALHETQSENWIQLHDSHEQALQAIATGVDPFWRVERATETTTAPNGKPVISTWTFTRSEEPAAESDEVKLTKFSQGADFTFTPVPVELSGRRE